jgi:hypothetical protein
LRNLARPLDIWEYAALFGYLLFALSGIAGLIVGSIELRSKRALQKIRPDIGAEPPHLDAADWFRGDEHRGGPLPFRNELIPESLLGGVLEDAEGWTTRVVGFPIGLWSIPVRRDGVRSKVDDLMAKLIEVHNLSRADYQQVLEEYLRVVCRDCGNSETITDAVDRAVCPRCECEESHLWWLGDKNPRADVLRGLLPRWEEFDVDSV